LSNGSRGLDVALDLAWSQPANVTCETGHGNLDVVVPRSRDRGDHVVHTAGQPGEHRARGVRVVRLAEDRVVEHDFGVGAEHRTRGQAALLHALPSRVRLGSRDALDVVQRGLVVERFLDDVAVAAGRCREA
jgi:hypothetical protein